MPTPTAPLPFADYLKRVNDETTKAACYRAAALATRHVPDVQRRLAGSPTPHAYIFMRDGTHMAFLVTLAALLEKTNNPIVNLHKLLGRLDDAEVRREIATQRGIDPAEVFKRVQKLQKHFDKRIAPLVPHVQDVRNNVVAHHGRCTDFPLTTIGLLNHAMGRVVVFVDALNELVTGDRTNIAETVRDVRYQAASLWSKGIDGDPEVALGPEDRDDWSGI